MMGSSRPLTEQMNELNSPGLTPGSHQRQSCFSQKAASCLSMELSVLAFLVSMYHILAAADTSCDQAQFLHTDGSCVDCPRCGPGEQLSEDCGYGDGGGGRCVPCTDGEYSQDTGLEPCWMCTQCHLMNRQERAPCMATANAVCGHCLPGFYEMRRKNRLIESLCLPCFSPTGGVRKDCLRPTAQPVQTSKAGKAPIPVSAAVIGSVSGASVFLLLLLLWVLLLALERLKQGLKLTRSQGAHSEPQPAELLQKLLPLSLPFATPSYGEPRPVGQTPTPADMPRGLNSVTPEKDLCPASIVINVTTNIKPSGQGGGEVYEWEGHKDSRISQEEMEAKLLEICAMTQGQTLDELDYDTVHDLSLLLDAGGREGGMCGLGRALGIPHEVLGNLRGFQDLFQYLRTSTYTLLPQLAEAAASLPRPDLIARIHRGLEARQTLPLESTGNQ